MAINPHTHDQLPAGHTLDECLRAALTNSAVDANYLAHKQTEECSYCEIRTEPVHEPCRRVRREADDEDFGSLRYRAALDLAAEFGNDVEEWLV